MLTSRLARRGMVSAPHHLAAQAGLEILREGGNAIEAMIAAASACAVLYPHMTGIGGDGFWIIHEPGRPPLSIDASGAAGAGASLAAYRERGLARVPIHGPLAACTVAGALSGWQSALDVSSRWGGRLPLSRLLGEAVGYARDGFAVSHSQERALRRLLGGLKDQPGFAAQFLEADGRVPRAGALQRNRPLAETLEALAADGLDSFYRGAVGQKVAAALKAVGAPVTAGDLARHRSIRRRPLTLALDSAVLHTTPPPTQGLTTLMLIGLFQRAGLRDAEGAAFVHAMVEAAKVAYRVRDAKICDPRHMGVHPATYLSAQVLDGLAGEIAQGGGAPTPALSAAGDTVWMGAVDGEGRAVSFSQSLCHAFGSGVMLGDTGILWHNRGVAFSLGDPAVNPLVPGRKPIHALNPLLARLRDGRTLVFGTMGGDGQPQTLAAIFARHVLFGQDPQAAISAPRWLLTGGPGGRDGLPLAALRLESRFDPRVVEGLRTLGHCVTLTDAFDEAMGHAGALIRHPDGTIEGAFDPRSDGGLAGW
ncbi:gamma-glutamyltransferase [Rhodospirillum rubrum]|uniref:gamma-glutamyltransferase family protein n=1 Tax=Rhodospirillum rubrum TaxID=1085 RepID=UPI0019047B31|nr:gamma-glutamyltransferase [Rhodospirillum rubrum]MBK1666189.1 gamma-glutamyltransferase [Rhodospirillum rubrum]MBK1678326.1 gamma-glutamyltransferase [Rhodospirillum rubrum]